MSLNNLRLFSLNSFPIWLNILIDCWQKLFQKFFSAKTNVLMHKQGHKAGLWKKLYRGTSTLIMLQFCLQIDEIKMFYYNYCSMFYESCGHKSSQAFHTPSSLFWAATSTTMSICLPSLVWRKWNGFCLSRGAISSQEWPKVTSGWKWHRVWSKNHWIVFTNQWRWTMIFS